MMLLCLTMAFPRDTVADGKLYLDPLSIESMFDAEQGDGWATFTGIRTKSGENWFVKETTKEIMDRTLALMKRK